MRNICLWSSLFACVAGCATASVTEVRYDRKEIQYVTLPADSSGPPAAVGTASSGTGGSRRGMR